MSIIYFMLIAVLMQTFTTVVFIVQFEANRSYYAAVLCVNKNRPELACEGKCVLMQRLQKDFQQEQESNNKTLQNLIEREITLFCQDFNIKLIHHTDIIIPLKTTNYSLKNAISQPAFSDVFHPPTYLV